MLTLGHDNCGKCLFAKMGLSERLLADGLASCIGQKRDLLTWQGYK